MSAPASSLLGRLDPRPKLLATVAFLLALSLIPQRGHLRLAILGGLLGLVLLLDGVWRVRTFWLRLLPITVFALSMGVLVALTRTGGPTHRLLGLGGLELRASDAGLRGAGELMIRTLLAAGALVTLTVRTSGPALLNGLARLRAPKTFMAVLGAVSRTLWLVTGEARRMSHARALRGGGSGPLGRRLRATGGIIGSLLLRSFDRSERVHRAMLARGYDGAAPPQLPGPPVRPAHLVLTSCFALLCVAIPWVPLP